MTAKFTSYIPGAEIPFVDTDSDGYMDVSYSWPDGTDSLAADFSARGTTDLSSPGWAYDSEEPMVRIELDLNSEDTGGAQFYKLRISDRTSIIVSE